MHEARPFSFPRKRLSSFLAFWKPIWILEKQLNGGQSCPWGICQISGCRSLLSSSICRANPRKAREAQNWRASRSSRLSSKSVPVFLFPGEALPLALALFAFVGIVLILVVALLSLWKMGRLLRHSCCPVVMLPDTLVTAVLPFSVMRCPDVVWA